MKERPILFSTPMVRAILAGRKTVTRRVVARSNSAVGSGRPWAHLDLGGAYADLLWGAIPGLKAPCTNAPPDYCPECWERVYPRWKVGGRLWVRETWGCPEADHPRCPDGRKPQSGDRLVYQANPADAYQWGRGRPSQGSFVWRPSIHMPRWASRLALEVTEVRVELLQEITHEDCITEGIERIGGNTSCTPWKNYALGPGEPFAKNCASPLKSFATLWDSLNAARGFGWDDNPWVWVVAFRRVSA